MIMSKGTRAHEHKEDENMLDAYITDITCEEFYGEDWDELMAELAEEEA